MMIVNKNKFSQKNLKQNMNTATNIVNLQTFSKNLILEKLLCINNSQLVCLKNFTLFFTFQKCQNNTIDAFADIFPKLVNLQTLKILFLRNQQLTALIPILSNSFSKLKNHLTSFSISLISCYKQDSNIECLCKGISKLIHLDSFNLKIRSYLTKQGLKSISLCLHNLVNLTYLKLDFSELNFNVNRQDTFGLLSKSLQRMSKLQKLFINLDESYIFYNRDAIHLSIGLSNKLDLCVLSLVFEKTSYKKIGIENLNHAISQLQNLKILIMKMFRNEDTDSQSSCNLYAPIIPVDIAKLPQLHTLIFELSRKKITDNLAQQNLLQTFKNLSSILNLQNLQINLEFTILTEDQARCLAKSLGELMRLKQLFLVLNYLKLSVQQSELLFLEISQLTQLKTLSLELDSTFVDVNPTAYLTSCLKKLVNLENLTLVISNQLVVCKEFFNISMALQSMRKLSFLNLKIAHMPNQDIPDKGISCSITLFTQIIYLQLSFEFPSFGIHCGQELSQGISMLINLRSLQLVFRFQKEDDYSILEELVIGILKLQRLTQLSIINYYLRKYKQLLLRKNIRLVETSDIEQTHREAQMNI